MTEHTEVIEDIIETKNEMVEEDVTLPRSIGGESSEESNTSTVGSRRSIRTRKPVQENKGQKKRDSQGIKSPKGMTIRRSHKKKRN